MKKARISESTFNKLIDNPRTPIKVGKCMYVYYQWENKFTRYIFGGDKGWEEVEIVIRPKKKMKTWTEICGEVAASLNAKRAAEVKEIVHRFTAEEWDALRASQHDVMIGNPTTALKPIKEKYGLSWGEIRRLSCLA